MADEALDRYRQKRDFDKSPEPSGHEDGGAPEGRLRFVVQHHRARRRHYDFRLEVEGVLASWAMPKGPSLDPSVRSLAVHVEDHPIEYRDFEGVIPKGEYGGGDVIVWDRGYWAPHNTDDPAAAIAGGEIHFDLEGEKLRGRFVLVRTRRQQGKDDWLMLHKRDDFAVEGWRPDDHPRSVKSGLTNDEVAAGPKAMWLSDRPAAEAELTLPDPGRPVSSDLPEWSAPTPDELAALDDLEGKGTWEFQGRDVQLTNLDKVLFPARSGGAPVTKRDLVRYYALIAPVMLRYYYDRPVNMLRFPNGSERPGFWHKAAPEYAPPWITRWEYEASSHGPGDYYFVVDNPPALAWMANYAAVELHPWTSSRPEVNRPTWALIDIDPGTATDPEDVLVLARLFRAGLEHLGVKAQPKLSGRRGVHIWIPIMPVYTFSQTSAWVEKLSRAVGATVPDLVSWKWNKNERSGLARLDYTQNALIKTLVGPYSVRAAAGAPVSAPVTWDELDNDDLRADDWTLTDLPGRVNERGDLWRELLDCRQLLPEL